MGLFNRSEIRLADFLFPERVVILPGGGKQGVLDSLIDLLDNAPEVTSKAELIQGIYSREKLMSTGIGLGIAIPHVRLASVKNIAMAAALVPQGIADYESLDNQPVRLVVMIVARENQHAEHLRLLSNISGKLKDAAFREHLFQAASTEELFQLLIK